mmetsp:Transcript_35641/g.55625  ORF Transcript_35641/g.55625 Transcript_35641/m.55625 type:complete len:924 (-) Transcript_35641:135-2906(-)|eukprot:CAMPEP_0201514052 /NCGR_PEP_ID=MMETSP0161_2-20130828/5977_1 /ASSEMBLY_ACC=CAM_ASM_000251 /TAXON_ID=180227 /ORGANISM="Neoparamoeba aestuarina, Strain SoJaBio B1-5/56/2" /LENGTH=923 /DNA_ID=CAMNT_0047910487 /DNA_START=148 /DNA_END=2919 /DNA_ORIENTATION=-
MGERRNFNAQLPPANYVAGLGRGAAGFTTRSDIGPARAASEMSEDGAAEDLSESNYDQFSGYAGSLFNKSDPYDNDDKEADEIYKNIDDRMEDRRKTRKEEKIKEEIEKYRKERPKIQQRFADLKRGLSTVSSEEWAAIPDIGDYTVKKKKREEKFVPASDFLLSGASASTTLGTSIDAQVQKGGLGGLQTPFYKGAETPMHQDLTQIGQARKTVLNLKLNSASDSVSGQTVVDPKGYLTDLSSIKISSDTEIGDIKKARLLLKSVTTTNPKHAPGWIAAARLEEMAGKLGEARRIISRGCEACPKSEDVWLEAARLSNPNDAKIILAKAVKELPNSVKAWLRAADLEKDPIMKKRVYRKALEYVPNSVRLWKAAVEMEKPEDARILLSRAVECVPQSVDMWIALAHLENYEDARKVLNQAREANRTNPQIWLTAAKLEDANGNEKAVKNIISKAITSLNNNNVYINRSQWIAEAVKAEKSGFLATCREIIREAIGIGVEEEDRKRTWLDDAEMATEQGAIQTARNIYVHTLSIFPGKKSVWLRYAFLEKSHGTKEDLDHVLSKAVGYCPQADILWLMGAKEKWLAGDVDAAREILKLAFKANPNKENIWLAAVKLEKENDEPERARKLLESARSKTSTMKVWRKSIKLERELRGYDREKQLCEEAVKLFPNDPKLWKLRTEFEEGRIGRDGTSFNYVRTVYQISLRACPKDIPLWIAAARFEERNLPTKARSMLEQARLQCGKSPELWLESIRVESRAGNHTFATALFSKALQDCPTSGLLWSQAILNEPRPRQNAKSFDALKRCDQDPFVICTVARIFLVDLKIEKSKRWFGRAVAFAPDIGDIWAWHYRFMLEHGTEAEQNEVVRKCTDAAPTRGEYWRYLSRQAEHQKKGVKEMLELIVSRLGSPGSMDQGPYIPPPKK